MTLETPFSPLARPTTRARNLMLGWLAISLLFWAWYLATQEFIWQFLYAYLWILPGGLIAWRYQEPITRRLIAWQRPRWQKFLLCGYFMVLWEEVYAATLNHFSEGVNLALWIIRIQQFWLFNLFAFTGFFAAWYGLLRRYGYTPRERFFMAGGWGLYAERVIVTLPVNPVAALLMAPLMIFTYGLIITPAMWSQDQPGTRPLARWKRWGLAFAVPFVCSLPPMIIMFALHSQFPWLFPPLHFLS
jgi:hypothetical protein